MYVCMRGYWVETRCVLNYTFQLQGEDQIGCIEKLRLIGNTNVILSFSEVERKINWGLTLWITRLRNPPNFRSSMKVGPKDYRETALQVSWRIMAINNCVWTKSLFLVICRVLFYFVHREFCAWYCRHGWLLYSFIWKIPPIVIVCSIKILQFKFRLALYRLGTIRAS